MKAYEVVVYLASPYRAEGEWRVRQNVEAAHVKARELWGRGIPTISPCSNTALFGGPDIPDETWLAGDLCILAKCDAILLSGDWNNSSGCKDEAGFARAHDIPIFTSATSLCKWVRANFHAEVY